MQRDVWTDVDGYLASLRERDTVLDDVIARCAAANLPDISVSPEQGMLLTVLARGIRARTILEIGTLGGYSAICLARALPGGGQLVSLEADEHHADVARANLAAAGCSPKVEVLTGPAVESLPLLETCHPGGFDFIFIDADKESYPEYWRWSLRLSHPGTMIVADNVIRDGAVMDGHTDDARVLGVREYLELVAADDRVVESTLQTVGTKGYDGFSIAVVSGGAAR